MRSLKIVFLLVFITETTLASSIIDNPLGKLQVKNVLASCKDKSGATRADFETLRLRQIPETKSGKCLMECMFENAGIMKDGKFNRAGAVVVLTPALQGDLTKLGKLKQLGQTCEDELASKKYANCEGGRKVLECLARNGKKFGVGFVSVKKD
ncbi:unnamed protein product [Phyllotreta striolata]|uniref:Uncharacterized protein n=1 Tax=Phyllotreta striolata TaxID=444603 RepID=A0A9N9TE71_PHYSR|nr:unnamed protein product [Phyllotreta striolata]